MYSSQLGGRGTIDATTPSNFTNICQYHGDDHDSVQERRSPSKPKTATFGSPRKTTSHTVSEQTLKDRALSPGPGEYHSPSKVSSSKTFVFGGRPAGPPPANNSTPGPGHYNLDGNPGNVVRSGKKITMTARSKMTGHSFTSRPKPRAKVDDDGPGPGTYYTQPSVASPRPGSAGGTSAFGPRSPRFAVKTEAHPGPGAYDTNHFDTMKHAKTKREKTNLKGATFGTARRARTPPTAAALSARGKTKATFFDEDVPGPGTYSHTNFLGTFTASKQKSSAFSGPPRFAAPKEQGGVGPGSDKPESDMNLRPDMPLHKIKGVRIAGKARVRRPEPYDGGL
mmetsp:Transcript_41272/g.110214  ORF Transcript_41272/g.110214 Transcript_41272/m.110214 type:complete len:338 (+) Transcript_41272:304-1317(+)